jgi:hypothetical protein
MYQSLLTLIVTGLMVWSSSTTYQTRTDPNRGWRPGTYRGLTPGKSTRADMLRIFGKPLSAVPSADQDPPEPIIWNDYGMIKGDLSGHLAVEFDSRNNKIVSISISPEQMTKEDAIKYFGAGYRLTGYEFCPGQAAEVDVGVVYEDPRSKSPDYLEYRSRGIAIHLDFRGNVNSIYYVDGPIGLGSKAECKRAIAKPVRRKRV